MFKQSFFKEAEGTLSKLSEKEKTSVDIKTVTSNSEEIEAIGVPVEEKNPLGYGVGCFTAFYTIVQGVIGTGIFATPATIVKSIGSIGAS